MLGTTFRLGFDGTSIARGLGNASNLLGRFGRQVGIGMARQVGAKVTDMMGKIVMAIPEALTETADWAGSMQDMSTQTGVSVEKLVLLEEQLRLSGAGAKDASVIMSKMAANIQDAANNGGGAADALAKIGLSAKELKGMGIDQQFHTIGKRLAELNATTKTSIKFNDPFSKQFGETIIETTEKLEDMESITADIFGAKMGLKLLRFFNDYDASVAQATNNVAALAKHMGGGGAAAMDTWSDALGRFETFKRSLASIALDEMFRVTGGPGSVDKMFDFLDPEKLRPRISEAMNMLGRSLEVFLSQDLSSSFSDVFKNIGRELGKGFRESFSIKDLLGIGAPSGGGSKSSSSDVSALIKESNNLLAAIRENVGIPKFA